MSNDRPFEQVEGGVRGRDAAASTAVPVRYVVVVGGSVVVVVVGGSVVVVVVVEVVVGGSVVVVVVVEVVGGGSVVVVVVGRGSVVAVVDVVVSEGGFVEPVAGAVVGVGESVVVGRSVVAASVVVGDVVAEVGRFPEVVFFVVSLPSERSNSAGGLRGVACLDVSENPRRWSRVTAPPVLALAVLFSVVAVAALDGIEVVGRNCVAGCKIWICGDNAGVLEDNNGPTCPTRTARPAAAKPANAAAAPNNTVAR